MRSFSCDNGMCSAPGTLPSTNSVGSRMSTTTALSSLSMRVSWLTVTSATPLIRRWNNGHTGEWIWTRDKNRFGWEALRGDYAPTDHRKGWFSPALAEDLSGLPPAYIVTGALDLFLDEDLDYARRAPEEQLRSGVGDALSNLSALADWELAAEDREEPIDGLAAAFARAGFGKHGCE